MVEHHDVDNGDIKARAKDIVDRIEAGSNAGQMFEAMRASLTPPYVWLFTKIGHLDGGVKFLVDMRASTIEFARSVDPNDVHCKNGLK